MKKLNREDYMVIDEFGCNITTIVNVFEATKEEIREYAMYGLPNPDMQFLF